MPQPRLNLTGIVGDRLQAVSQNWLLQVPHANPAILEIFNDRDIQPYRDLLPWSGEFAGKYLTSAVQVYRLTREPRLRSELAAFVSGLIRRQDADGYLGPWPADSRLTNFSAVHGPPGEGLLTWDTWGHYHISLGLLLWHEATGDAHALKAASPHRRPDLHPLPGCSAGQTPGGQRLQRDEPGACSLAGHPLPQDPQA